LTLDDDLQKIVKSANDIDGLFQKFRKHQTNDKTDFIPHLKQDLRKKLQELREQLDHYLAYEYKIVDSKESEQFLLWKTSHQPFHWIVEFYGILKNGGFDVVIGNPPYVEYSKVKKSYTIKDYKTEHSGNLYGFIIERAIQISKTTLLGFIIPLAAFGTPSTISLRDILANNCKELFVSYYSGDAHPAVLFDGVKLRLSIILSNNCSGEYKYNLFTTNYIKWYSIERNFLFASKLSYTKSINTNMITFPKVGYEIEKSIIKKIMMKQKTISSVVEKISNHKVFYHNAPVFFIRAMNFIPFYKSNNSCEPSSNHFKTLFTSALFSEFLLGVLNSSTFFLWFTNYSACRDLTNFDIYNFPLYNKEDNISIFNEKLATINRMLMTDINEKSVIREYNYSTGKVTYQEFYMRESKLIIDEIDRLLAEHYGFTDEELDFIINYDIKYRMGGEEE
jgi:hypothetical protein